MTAICAAEHHLAADVCTPGTPLQGHRTAAWSQWAQQRHCGTSKGVAAAAPRRASRRHTPSALAAVRAIYIQSWVPDDLFTADTPRAGRACSPADAQIGCESPEAANTVAHATWWALASAAAVYPLCLESHHRGSLKIGLTARSPERPRLATAASTEAHDIVHTPTPLTSGLIDDRTESSITGTSASGHMSISGTKAPWSRPRLSGAWRGLKPARLCVFGASFFCSYGI